MAEPNDALVAEALACSRGGDLTGAIVLLQSAHATDSLPEAGVSLLFVLLRTATIRAELEDPDHTAELLALCQTGLARADTPLLRSTWRLRRGLLLLAHNNKAAAVQDLTEVLKLRATDDHQAQARRALLQAAQLGKPRR
jgi:hypothetical protein